MGEFTEDFLETATQVRSFELEDYQRGTPRWCKGCGDFGLLDALQRILQEHQVERENVTCVSGIGCSSRLPHYLKTYGFHGIHGRALPVSTGIELSRPDLKVITIMGDGDCLSIGGNHFFHAVRYNINALVLVLDNEIYALTKKQVSPTTPQGGLSNTTPKGSYLEAFNPLRFALGITNVSFVAQTATWLPDHMEKTLARAWQHKGLAFIRVLQRCPIHVPDGFGGGGGFPGHFLEHDNGINADQGILRSAPHTTHNPEDLEAAIKVVLSKTTQPLGLVYHDPNSVSYGEMRRSQTTQLDLKGQVQTLNDLLDRYTIN